MNFRKGIEPGDEGFQIAPMIDVVFIILVFFVTIAAMEENEKEIEIKPPRSASSAPIRRRTYEIVVNVKQDGTIIVNRNAWDLPTLRSRLKMLSSSGEIDSSVMIRADALTLHQNVVNVIDACMDADISRFSFITVEAQDEADR